MGKLLGTSSYMEGKGPDDGVCLPSSPQPRESVPLSEENQGQGNEPRKGHGDSELVANSAQTILGYLEELWIRVRGSAVGEAKDFE